MSFKYLAVLDFEATCETKSVKGWNLELQEVIEIPVALISIESRQVVGNFNAFVKPIRQPILTDFCTQLTSIKQSDVDSAQLFENVIIDLQKWLQKEGANETNTLVITCGDWDLKTMWAKELFLNQKVTQLGVFKNWCNLKKIFSKEKNRKAMGMMGMLEALNIPHQGHHHRGADDVVNLGRIVIELLNTGTVFEPTFLDKDRQKEASRWSKKYNNSQEKIHKQKSNLRDLPLESADTLRSKLKYEIEKEINNLDRLKVLVDYYR